MAVRGCHLTQIREHIVEYHGAGPTRFARNNVRRGLGFLAAFRALAADHAEGSQVGDYEVSHWPNAEASHPTRVYSEGTEYTRCV